MGISFDNLRTSVPPGVLLITFTDSNKIRYITFNGDINNSIAIDLFLENRNFLPVDNISHVIIVGNGNSRSGNSDLDEYNRNLSKLSKIDSCLAKIAITFTLDKLLIAKEVFSDAWLVGWRNKKTLYKYLGSDSHYHSEINAISFANHVAESKDFKQADFEMNCTDTPLAIKKITLSSWTIRVYDNYIVYSIFFSQSIHFLLKFVHLLGTHTG